MELQSTKFVFTMCSLFYLGKEAIAPYQHFHLFLAGSDCASRTAQDVQRGLYLNMRTLPWSPQLGLLGYLRGSLPVGNYVYYSPILESNLPTQRRHQIDLAQRDNLMTHRLAEKMPEQHQV